MWCFFAFTWFTGKDLNMTLSLNNQLVSHQPCKLTRLTPTMICKCIHASAAALCITKWSSNRIGKEVGILHCEERGEVKMNQLSPAMHFPGWCICFCLYQLEMRSFGWVMYLLYTKQMEECLSYYASPYWSQSAWRRRLKHHSQQTSWFF